MLSGDTPPDNFFVENFLETKEFQIISKNKVYLILIGRSQNSVTVKSLNHSVVLNPQEIAIVAEMMFHSIIELYNFIINIFNNNGVQINIENNDMNLYLSFFNMNTKTQKNFMISLKYSAQNTDYFINNLFQKITNLESENNSIKMNNQYLLQEINNIKQEIQSLKNNSNMNNMNNINNMMNNMNLGNNISNINIMNNQLMNSPNQQMNNINNINTNINNGNISVILKEQGGGSNVKSLHNCSPNDTIEKLMERYREKIKNKNFKFYLTYNAKFLNPKKTLKEIGYTNYMTFNVIKGDPPNF